MDSFHLPRPWSHSFMFVLCQHEGGCTRKFYMILRGFSAVYLCKVKLIGFSLYKTTSQWISGLPKMPKSSGRISWGDSLDRAAARCSIPGKWFSPRTPVRHPGLKLWLNPSWTAWLWEAPSPLCASDSVLPLVIGISIPDHKGHCKKENNHIHRAIRAVP